MLKMHQLTAVLKCNSFTCTIVSVLSYNTLRTKTQWKNWIDFLVVR